MVPYRDGRHGEVWMVQTVTWAQKPRSRQERIEAWLEESDLDHLLTAKEALEQPGIEAERLLRSLVHRDAHRSRIARKQLRVSLLLVGLVGVTLIFEAMLNPTLAGQIAVALLLISWLLLPCLITWGEEYRRHRRRLSNTVALLHRLPEASSIAEMIEAWEVGDEATTCLAAKSLTQRLPNLAEADCSLLTPKHHRALRRVLRGYNPELILAILHSSDRILNTTALPEVRWLARCPDWIAECAKIQEAARLALPGLETKARCRYTVNTLLRPAEPLQAPVQELLHPIALANPTAPHELLHAAGESVASAPQKADSSVAMQ